MFEILGMRKYNEMEWKYKKKTINIDAYYGTSYWYNSVC